MAAGRRPPRHNRLTRRRDAEKTRQSNPQPTGDPQTTDPIRANRARDALVLATATAQSSSGRERPSPSYEKCALGPSSNLGLRRVASRGRLQLLSAGALMAKASRSSGAN